MKSLMFLSLIGTLILASCGGKDPKFGSSTPATNQTPGAASPDSEDPPVVVASEPKATKKKKKHPPKAVPQARAQAPAAPVSNSAPQPAPAPVAAPQPPAVPEGPTISTFKKIGDPEWDLVQSRGLMAAVLDARFCAVSDKFTDGSSCYIVFSDGKTGMPSQYRTLALSYADKIEADYKAKKEQEEAQNPDKKKHKIFPWQWFHKN